jgi:hypothetical protein
VAQITTSCRIISIGRIIPMEENSTKVCSKCRQSCEMSLFRGHSKMCRPCKYSYEAHRNKQIADYGGPYKCIHCNEVVPIADIYQISAAGRGTCRSCNNTRRRKRRKNEGYRITERLSKLRNGAKKRGIHVSLSIDQYRSMVEGASCHYCGFPLPKLGGGLDRIDNCIGYSKDNCVPCCFVCNVARNNNFTVSEMLRIGEVIREIRLEREAIALAA